MSPALAGRHVGFFERPHPPGYRGALADDLVPLLRDYGARVNVVHAEQGFHRLDEPPPWDLVVLKSGSAAALHLASAAEAWGVACLNASEATRLAQDKLASAALLQRAGLPIAPGRLAWLGADVAGPGGTDRIVHLADRPLVVKAARGSQGAGLWRVGAGELAAVAPTLPEGPYLLMEWVPHTGDDLKIFVAGPWLAAIERPFPAKTLEEKHGRPVPIPEPVREATHEAGRLLGLSCYGCDFVRGPTGWMLVDVNAFPGYKGAAGAPEALAAEIARVAAERPPR